jgi:hypothetical protein
MPPDTPPPGAVRLPLTGKHAETWPYATLDAADLAYAEQWNWGAHPLLAGGQPLVMRSYRDGGKIKRAVLARELLKPPGGAAGTVEYINGDSLDLRRANLYWRRPGEGSNVDLAARITQRLGPAAADERPRGPDELKALARRLGITQADLLALEDDNDPFVSGRPSHHTQAAWFAEVWQTVAAGRRLHLRGIHYAWVSRPDARDWRGEPYLNTDYCWSLLLDASKHARYLRYVRYNAFVDNRAPAPIEPWLGDRHEDDLAASVEFGAPWRLPTIGADLTVEFDLPEPELTGYDYAPADQPYRLEVWVEKSSTEDALLPVCREYGATLVQGVGFLSITAVGELLERVAKDGRPAMIFYISDLDPSGTSMPTAVARQIEFWLEEVAPDGHVQLTPLAVTRAQADAEPRLPRTPLKETVKGQDRFAALYGEGGGVELDALEALRPGALPGLVRDALAAYYDRTLFHNLSTAESKACNAADEAWEQETADLRAELDAIRDEAEQVAAELQPEADALKAKIDERFAPLQRRLDDAWQAATEHGVSRELDVELPERPEPECPADYDEDRPEPLYDSTRPYLEQIIYYRARKRGS